METGQYPTVTLLHLSPSASTDHHGSSSRRSVALPADDRPRWFRNPWPSYRVASLNDAWIAYQKGAAIALPHPKVARSSNGLDEQEDDADDNDGLVGREETSLLRTKSRVYVRPEFAAWYEDDHDDDWRDPPTKVVQPSWGEVGEDKETVTWLGHAGVLVQIPWKRKEDGRQGMCGVLFDPIFSYRCSPSQYVGPARYLDPPCTVRELPDIHVCCISHDHYDHLDYYTIMDLWKYHQSTIHFFVPLGLKTWFTSSGIPATRVTELDWWHEALLSFSPTSPFSSSSPPEEALHYPPHEVPTPHVDAAAPLTLKVAFTPAQHRSGRGVFDHMTTLWGSWCLGVVGEEHTNTAGGVGMKGWGGFKVFFGGDTGYRYATAPEADPDATCPAFQDIADLYSPFTLALLPLSTGSSLPFLRNLLSLSLDQYTLTSSLHCSPADAIEIHKVLGVRRSIGIHWGTFCDADEARGTRVEFGRVRRAKGVAGSWVGDGDGEEEEEDGAEGKGRFVVCDIGETLVFP